jgi:profilin
MKVISSIVSGDSAARDKAYGDGLYLAGERYVMTKAEDRSIYARSVRVPGEQTSIATGQMGKLFQVNR